MSFLYHTFIREPLYNGLILVMDLFPWADAGVAVIIFTIVVKLILFPLSKKAVITQLRMKEIEPEMNRIKEKIKDRQAQALAVMELYKSKGVNPFSGILNIIIQLPILIALYTIFLRSGLPNVDIDILYPFVKVPELINMEFLGFVNIAEKSIILSVIAAAAQYFQIRFSLPPTPPAKQNASFQEDLARNVNMQMRYLFPIIILFISYTATATIAIYLIISSLFTIGQELYIRKKLGMNKPVQQQ